jgi:hypothetical protein
MLSESYRKRIKELAGIYEVGQTVQAPAAQAQQQQQAQPQVQQNPQVQQDGTKADAAIETNLKAALDNIVKQLPNVLNNFANTVGDKGEIDIKGQEPANNQQNNTQEQPQNKVNENSKVKQLTLNEDVMNEAVGMAIAGAALSAPVIIKGIGTASNWLGKKVDSMFLQKTGEKLKKVSDSIHHAYIKTIEVVLKPLMKGYTDKQIHSVANAIFLAIVATMGVGAATGAATAISQGNAVFAGIEGALASVKAGEVSNEVIKSLPTILSKIGLS